MLLRRRPQVGQKRLHAKQKTALALGAPSVLFLAVFFLLPIAWMLARSASDGGASYVRAVQGRNIDILGTTIRISIEVAALSLLAAYPIAYALTRLSPVLRNILMLAVLIPYTVSALVRTFAWIILLGNTGYVNEILSRLALPGAPYQFLFNETGVLIGMTYVLMPYAIFILYAVMKNVDPKLLQAAASLGARPTVRFLKIYLPLTLHGVIAGWLIVFILSVGYFITPALMGGPKQRMIANEIEFTAMSRADWPLAAAMAALLLGLTLIVILAIGIVIRVRGGNRS